MIEQFTVEEINLMCIYNTDSRIALMQDIIEAIDGFEPGDPLSGDPLSDDPQSDGEIFEIAQNALNKVSKMTDAEFDALELYPIFDDETEVDS